MLKSVTCCTGHVAARVAANNRLGHGFVNCACTGVTGRHRLAATSWNQMQMASIDILKDSWSTNQGWENTELYGWNNGIMALTNSSTVKTLQQYFNEITQYNFHTPSLDYAPTNYIYIQQIMDPIVHNWDLEIWCFSLQEYVCIRELYLAQMLVKIICDNTDL